jgi:HAD superfamily hydrolase (TIGR01509 family)
MLKGVLLDIDGTLVLSNDAHAHAWVEAFSQFGYTVEFDEVRRLIGMGADKLIASVQPGLTDTEGTGKKIKEARSKIFLEKYAPHLQPAPGSRDLIEALQANGLKTIAASSSKSDELSALLKAARVDDLLTQATTSDDVDNSKPDPDIVQVALDKIGVRPDEAIMIGDTPYDIEAAARAGVRCIAVRCGGWEDEELAGAAAIYADPADIAAQIGALTKL